MKLSRNIRFGNIRVYYCTFQGCRESYLILLYPFFNPTNHLRLVVSKLHTPKVSIELLHLYRLYL